MTRESGLTNSDLEVGDVLISVNKHGPIHLVISIKEGVIDGQIIVKLLDLQKGNVFARRLWVNTKLSTSYKLLRREEGGA